MHGARRYVSELPTSGNALVKLDFRNAFNTLRRDVMLETTTKALPEAFAFINAAYSAPSTLFYGSDLLSSEEGVQQGDPLGPLLFCLTLNPVITDCSSELRIAYLDDVSLGGDLSTLESDVQLIKARGLKLGLELNKSDHCLNKCEIIVSHTSTPVPQALAPFSRIKIDDAVLLGSALSSSLSLDDILTKRLASFKTAAVRLRLLHAHDALLILKHSLSIPALLHNLRSSFCCGHPLLETFDAEVRKCLSAITNVDYGDIQWLQATLPVRDGGLGIRRASQLAPSAFLASAFGCSDLISAILPQRLSLSTDPLLAQAQEAWSSASTVSHTLVSLSGSQRAWDTPIIDECKRVLFLNAPNDVARACLLAVMAPHTGDWLHAPPLSAVGLRLEDDVIRISIGLRLGATLCHPHSCPCGVAVDALGHHGLSCQRSAGRQLRHRLINDIIHKSLLRAGVAANKEPAGLLVGSAMRPDGGTMIPWARGKCLAWDATTPDTLAPSHLPSTCTTAGAAAAAAAQTKTQKYAALSASHIFVPVAVETLGTWDAQGIDLIREIGRRTTLITKDPRETSFLLQRISVAVQRGNAASIAGSLPPEVP